MNTDPAVRDTPEDHADSPETTAEVAQPGEAQPTFADLGIDERVLRALSDVGYEMPSPIQAAAIPPLMQGRHLVGLAQTGTGKTAAFALPVLSRIDLEQRAPQALVLAPTRELALQVAEAFGRYSHHIPGLHVLPIYGGQSYGVQLSGLKRGAHIVVGTPGRVIDHLEKRTLDLSQLKYLVLDEADEMLQMGFQEDVETILATTPEQKQVALFSATMPPQIRRISKKYLTDAAEITVANRTVTSTNTRQRYIFVGHQQKLDALTRVLEVEDFEAMIIFVRTKQATEELAERLRSRGFSAAAINGDLAQQQRERTIGQLKSGQLDILVATDVAARGLDVERITHVVNYDIPHDSESYVHRIGRTGRAGRSGEALLFVTPREKRLLGSIERATRSTIEEMPLPSVDDVNSTRVTKFTDSIKANLDSPEAAVFRGLIEEYIAEHDVPAAAVAAALAVIAQDGKSFLLPPDPPPSARRPAREPNGVRDRNGRPAPRVAGPRRPRGDVPLATYRISVGRRHRVQPGAIVGAIANEGGLGRGDFGHIDIQADHTLVELPANLSRETVEALTQTRISGKLIQLTKTDGPPPQRARSGFGERKQFRKSYPGK
ncbi:DEAD/DEAH box helicase [Kineosporia rhizophila]|uniref:DEAD/DEAH box helicase n=1 Tax=Kineosporia TaxID=49184 RepID=UPI001E3B40BC|nr:MULTISPECIES: DEAD/DEAH box helicase [Kineosporia]MCE0540018.1 DEAD/DEAH box helicase [Kineosporia rhizophila]GLY14376.1 ATP-dependent RNA helicase DeaD [Kineosporia sp. NBRC 101677]